VEETEQMGGDVSVNKGNKIEVLEDGECPSNFPDFNV